MKKLILSLFVAAVCTVPMGCGDAEDDVASKFNVLAERVNRDNAEARDIIVMIEASADIEWTASVPEPDTQWLTLEKSSGTGIGRIIFSLAENEQIESRSSSISVTGRSVRNGREYSAPAILVTQLGAAPSILIEPAGSVSLASDAIAEYSVEVTANLEWRTEVEIISGEPGWISAIYPDEPYVGAGVALFSIAENTTEESRIAVLRVVYTDDPTVCGELTVTQMRAPARYNLTIQGMDGTLPTGNASLLIESASGEELTRSGSVVVVDSDTSISYDEALPAGEYTLVSVTPEGGSPIYLGGRFTIGEESVCTEMEHWYAIFESFGGESAERPIRIAKPAHLMGLATSVNEGTDYAGFYFLQTADISLSEYANWVGIGSASCRFAGVYDGDGHNITGLTITSSGAESVDGVTCGHALFRHVGGVDAEHLAEIRNLKVSGAATGSAGHVAGIVARCADHVLIYGCENAVSLRGSASGPGNMGGIVSVVAGCATIEHCVNRGEITAEGSGNVNNVGGIAGQADGASAENRALVADCCNYGKITYQGNSGGIVGTTMGNIDIVRCANYGELSKTGTTVVRVGGLVGSFQGDATLRESFNLGRVDGYRHTGGVIGWCQNNGVVENCYNRGEVVAQGSTGNTGGIVGNINTDGFVVRNCYNAGQFTQHIATDANRYAAIAGSGNSNTSGVENCYYEADKGMIGGLGRGSKKQAVDIAGQSEQKDAAWFTSGTPIAGWDTSVWVFSAGSYPTLASNPEK